MVCGLVKMGFPLLPHPVCYVQEKESVMNAALMFILIAVICFVGILAGRQVTNAAQWANGGKNLTWVTVGILLVTFQIGGTSTIGAAQNGYVYGIAGIWYGVTGTAAMLLSSLFIGSLRKYITQDTVANFMENRYSKGVSSLYSYAYLLMGFVYIPIQLFTLTTVFQTIMPNLTLTWACVIGLILAISYTVISGVNGANYVSKVSCILMYITMAIGLGIAFQKTGGMANLKSTLDASYFTPFTMPTKTWFSWFLTCFVAFLTMQAAIQPSLIAKDDSNARKGIVFGALLNLPCAFICAFLGMIAIAMKLIGPESSSLAFATTINTYCPGWLTALVFAAIGLIVICTLAGQLLAIGTIIRELLMPIYTKNNFSEKKNLAWTRIIAFLYGFLTIIPTFAVQRSMLNQLCTTLIACVTGPMFFSLVAGMYWKKMNTKAAAASIISGLATGIIWVISGLSASWQPVYAILPISSLIGFLVCLATSKQTEIA